MHDDRTPGDAGQNPANDTPSLVDLMEKNVRALVRISAVLARLSARIDALERKPALKITITEGADDNEDSDGPATERETKGIELTAPLALRSDGSILIHVSEIDGLELPARERWEGVVLTAAETSDALEYLGDGISEAAGRVGGWIAQAAKRAKAKEGGEES